MRRSDYKVKARATPTVPARQQRPGRSEALLARMASCSLVLRSVTLRLAARVFCRQVSLQARRSALQAQTGSHRGWQSREVLQLIQTDSLQHDSQTEDVTAVPHLSSSLATAVRCSRQTVAQSRLSLQISPLQWADIVSISW